MNRRILSTTGVLAVQVLLGLLCWGGLGFASARAMWLFGVRQALVAAQFFRWQFPFLGAVGAVLVPGLLYDRLRTHEEESVVLDTEFLSRVLAFPRRAAMASFVTSVFLFSIGAAELRLLTRLPVEEAFKIFILGPVTGLIYATLSYLLLSDRARPLAAAALEKGALPASRPTFSIGRKVFLCLLALCLATLGLCAPIALSWAQRYVEAQATVRNEAALSLIADQAVRQHPAVGSEWQSFLQAHLGPVDELAVLDGSGLPMARAALPGRGSRFLDRSENLDFLAIRQPGSFASRADDNLIVSNVRLGRGLKLVSALRPDRSMEKVLLSELTGMGIAVILFAITISWVAGRGVARPIAELEAASRKFAADPQAGVIPLVPSDDETGMLSAEFSRMAGSVRTMQERLARSERLAGAVESLAAVAHQIRNPLFGITATVASLESELGHDPQYRKHLEIIVKESGRLSNMIGEMLALKSRSGSVLSPGRLERVAEEAGGWLSVRFPDRAVRFHLDAPPGLPAVRIDSERMLQVFTNLFENSVLSAGGDARIDVRLRAQAENLVAEVEDSGPGIPPETRARVFEAFFSGRESGTGLGLAVCRSIVEEHGGSLEIADSPGGGALFVLRLPAVIDSV
jgi:signal transduction histidine kinase